MEITNWFKYTCCKVEQLGKNSVTFYHSDCTVLYWVTFISKGYNL